VLAPRPCVVDGSGMKEKSLTKVSSREVSKHFVQVGQWVQKVWLVPLEKENGSSESLYGIFISK
jgi:hypothetical protein